MTHVQSYAIVKDDNTGIQKSIPVVHNAIPFLTLEHLFPNAYGLQYVVNGNIFGLIFDEDKFLLPEVDLTDTVFEVVYKPVIVPPVNHQPCLALEFVRALAEIIHQNLMLKKEREDAKSFHCSVALDRTVPIVDPAYSAVIDRWGSRVFNVNGGLEGCCVLLDKGFILTASSLKFTVNETYPVRDIAGRVVSAKCLFDSPQLDFAILHSDDFPDLSYFIGSIGRGSKYYTFGYPRDGADKPLITSGIVETLDPDRFHLNGSRKGFSGNPVFDGFGNLAGIFLGTNRTLSTDSTFDEQSTSRILPINVIVARIYEIRRKQRLAGPPKEDKLVVQFAEVPADDAEIHKLAVSK
uniref:Serine protease n=1 Tax=Panagrolaimus sp. JU765 TaxID=591449 RepID=A0AC34RPH6_9BILA